MSLFEINLEVNRPDPELIAELAQISTAMLSDAMANLYTMDSGIQAILPGKHICGPACTVATRAGDFISVLKALEAAAPGDVLVIDNQSRPDTAMWGEITTVEAQAKGICGLVVDGLIRDVAGVRHLGFPVFARGTTPRVAGQNSLGEVNVVVQCGGVVVAPGDIIVADDDGVVVVPQRKVHDVLMVAKAILRWEEDFKDRIAAGKSQVSLLDLDRKTEVLRKEMARKLGLPHV